MNEEYKILLSKLDKFIRKYYVNQVIRGLLLSLILYLVFYISVSISEYYGHFSIGIRTGIFYSLLSVFSIIFIWFILVPILSFFKIGKTISHKQASRIISNHFSDIQDKLLNTLELANIAEENSYSQQLVYASIDQRIEQIKPIPFRRAINFKRNFSYFKYIGLIAIVFAAIFIISPALLTEGAERIVNHDTYYEPKVPFKFILKNDSLFAEKGGDIEIFAKIEGEYVPKKIFISFGSNSFIMKKIDNSEFSYKFRNLNNSLEFFFNADNYHSQNYTIEVLPAPVILDFVVSINSPTYTQEPNRILNNVGDLTVPFGSKIIWNFKTIDIDSLFFIFENEKKPADFSNDEFKFEKKFLESKKYALTISNSFYIKKEIVKYFVNVIPDLYPNIQVASIVDSIKPSVFYFKGNIDDDYGFKNLSFVFSKNEENDSIVNIPISKNLTIQEFYYSIDFAKLNISNEDKIEYYFMVWDNDAVLGSKSSRTRTYEYSIPSEEELQKLSDDANKNIFAKIDESMKLAEKLKKDIKQLKEKNINENSTTWEKTQMVEEIMKNQSKLEELMQEIADENELKNDVLNSFSEEEQEILDKQQQIEDLLENLMTDELKELMDELNKLQEKFNEDKFNQLSDDLEMSFDDLMEQLDRNLEMLKEFEVEQKVEKNIEDLNELAKEQEELSEETKDKKSENSELQKKQNEQSEKFEKLTEEIKKTQELNDELKNPMKMENLDQEIQDINEEFQKGSENLQKGKSKKASGNQKKNSEQLSEMSQSMQQMLNSNKQQQAMEDMDNLRQILDNLINFSFDQEELLKITKKISDKDPLYIDLIGSQNKIADDFTIIKDSLYALAKRTPQLSSTINRELLSIEKNLSKTNLLIEDRKKGPASIKQQFVMTSANNLALLLAEALKSMQNQMSMDMQGQQQCQKEGKGKPSMKQMQGMQESLKSQLQSLIDQMKKKDGKGKPDKNGMNKQLARMLAQQEIFQKMMSEMAKNQSLKSGTKKIMNEIKKLIDQTENDLINKNITPQTLKRQELILTRLLDAENSEYQREIEKKRESKEGNENIFSNPEEIFKYKDVNLQFNEILKTSNIKLINYYNKKYKEYLVKLNEN
ncbi:MAG: hypothetical protein HN704_14185 [Bacteroidetes bacterium]|jgi:hypothetical protein|nr:hypothetical protein [Bacteroidota bacterium]MBT6685361.1 hypothetical protein [Bacteroidota bacterium]MBT7145059.1 hypothetical protein [Bacteroidota bacterium]MBT7492744.1 hypothetical protein [Bacteroidota bacterium]